MNIYEEQLFIAKFARILQSDNLKFTVVREDILRVMLSKEHLKIDDILEALANNFSRYTTKQTIYKTLKLLKSYGMIIQHNHKHATYYELIRETQHCHLICVKCKAYQEFRDPFIQESLASIAKKANFRLDKTDVNIYGLCPKCK